MANSNDSLFPMEYPQCQCGHNGTLAQLACKGDPNIKEGVFISMKQEMVPIGDVRTALTVRVLVLHKDVCSACGIERVTRAEIQNVPVQVQGRPPGLPPFMTRG